MRRPKRAAGKHLRSTFEALQTRCFHSFSKGAFSSTFLDQRDKEGDTRGYPRAVATMHSFFELIPIHGATRHTMPMLFANIPMSTLVLRPNYHACIGRFARLLAVFIDLPIQDRHSAKDNGNFRPTQLIREFVQGFDEGR